MAVSLREHPQIIMRFIEERTCMALKMLFMKELMEQYTRDQMQMFSLLSIVHIQPT